MSSLPPALDFAAMETDIVAKWKEEEAFATQDKLSLERGDKVRFRFCFEWSHTLVLILKYLTLTLFLFLVFLVVVRLMMDVPFCRSIYGFPNDDRPCLFDPDFYSSCLRNDIL